MKTSMATLVGIVAVAAIGSGLAAPASAGANDDSGRMIVAAGYGMMGGGMMGSGMMGQANGEEAVSSTAFNPARAGTLAAYIQAQHLSCMQCHAMSGSSFGPAFDRISTLYAHRPDAAGILEKHIAHGYGRMPAGMATEIQSASLAKLILGLTDSAR